MNIYFYQAECGDAARIRYKGNDNEYHNIFIDAGYERTFRQILKKEIFHLQNKGEIIDLWVVSHIHDDHIGGIIAYLKAIEYGEFSDIVESWIYNSPRLPVSNTRSLKKQPISNPKSIVQGDYLAQHLLSINKYPAHDFTNDLPVIDLYGLIITILSPNNMNLQKLRSKYSHEPHRPFERYEGEQVSEAKATAQSDYHIPVQQFDLTNWKEDISEENASSISLLVEHENKKALWLADAHPSVVVSSLTRLGYSPDKPLVCDYIQVAHHGSKGNNSSQLYDLIRCENYIISANATNRYCLPHKECIVRILCNKYRLPNSHYRIHFTYDNQILQDIFKVDGEDVFSNFNFSTFFLDSQIMEIEL